MKQRIKDRIDGKVRVREKSLSVRMNGEDSKHYPTKIYGRVMLSVSDEAWPLLEKFRDHLADDKVSLSRWLADTVRVRLQLLAEERHDGTYMMEVE
jgi:hypothetical protein